MFTYDYKNDLSLLAEAFKQSESTIKLWQKSKPKQAFMLDNAFNYCDDYDELKLFVNRLVELETIKEVNAELGLPSAPDRLVDEGFSKSAYWKWFKENRHLYVAMVMGYSEFKVQNLVTNTNKDLIANILTNLSKKELVSLYISDADSLIKLINSLK
ncbi:MULTISPECIES: hypothetical protein [Vibrio harveyi group]|uniref:hypothetical protein n=1 Tax=Vibrio harveyi group TaxID=717610 RepID=UPI0006CA756B|nr:hypothetical protein [Vibrio alginolyticus]KPM92284.1 hypothetical protein AOR10_13890 [Vibrio alginolyticus]